MTTPALDWRLRAACRTEHPSLFFGAEDEKPRARRAREAQARAVCALCPVTASCLDFALASGAGHGVWGGTGEAERRALPGFRAPRWCARYLYLLPEGVTRCWPCCNARERALRAGRRKRAEGSEAA
jgi:WhiB family transcriptional regulator, redox-sensing transcriptional regulator